MIFKSSSNKIDFMDRAILHIDINSCYAQIECQDNPQLRNKPVVVGGNEKDRHGIVLAKNQIAKEYGIPTACTLREARNLCPSLTVVPPHFDKYKRVSKATRKIYYQYSSQVEPFSIDEAWIDITNSLECLGKSAEEVAFSVNKQVKDELGLTTSVGLSWNKIFAKFGSDYKKPDAITIITRDNYKKIVWESDVRKLLYVGAATERKLNDAGIFKIGELASASDTFLSKTLGKVGFMLRDFALGNDTSPVKTFEEDKIDVSREIKSYGNGITFPRDITDSKTARAVTHMLGESVSQRMREDCTKGKTVSISIRYAHDLSFITRQKKLGIATNLTNEICDVAWSLMDKNHKFTPQRPVRSLSVSVSDLIWDDLPQQQLLFDKYEKRKQLEYLDKKIDEMRKRFGNNSIMWGAKASDEDTAAMDIKSDNTVHPISYLHK